MEMHETEAYFKNEDEFAMGMTQYFTNKEPQRRSDPHQIFLKSTDSCHFCGLFSRMKAQGRCNERSLVDSDPLIADRC